MQSLGTPRYAAPPCLPSAAAVGTPPNGGRRCCGSTLARDDFDLELTARGSTLLRDYAAGDTAGYSAPARTSHRHLARLGLRPEARQRQQHLRLWGGGSWLSSSGLTPPAFPLLLARLGNFAALFSGGTPLRPVLRETLATKIRQIRRWRGVARAPHDGQPGLAANSASAGPLVPDAFCGGTPTQKMEVYPVHGPTPCTGTTSLQ